MKARHALCLSAALPLVATIALAQPPGPRHPGMPPGGPPPIAHLERGLRDLGLEPEQMQRVQSILDAAKERRRANHPQLRQAFEEMRTLLEQEPPDEDAVLRQAEKIGALKTDQHKTMLRTLLAVRAELTPEQRAKLKDMRHHRMGRFGDWGRRRGLDVPDED